MTLFHYLGEWVRQVLTSIPTPLVRVLFVAFFLILIVWVWRLPRERWAPAPGGEKGISTHLKLWALLALGIQLAIYLIF
jgi:hypothetical protein